MIETVLYGFTLGSILYLFSIGLSITFGTMHIINFTHALIYTLGVYIFIFLLQKIGGSFSLSLILSTLSMIPLAYAVERYVIRRLYGESLDYAIIATYGVLLIGMDLVKLIWGTSAYPVADPVGLMIGIGEVSLPLYRLVIVLTAILIFYGLRVFLRKSLVGRIVIAALEDPEGVRCLGIDVNRYFSFMFIVGSVLAVIGGILYAPISTTEPYMGFHILLLAFAVVIVGGLGNLSGTFFSAMVMGMVMAVTGRLWPPAAQVIVFILMALVLIFRPVKA
ncbi:MAG: branched-chain amino acid ABC transporter permease [Thermoplasmatales archaeon]